MARTKQTARKIRFSIKNLPSGSTIENALPDNLKTLRNLSEEQYEIANKTKEENSGENLPSGSTIENALPDNLKTLRNLSEEQYEIANKTKEENSGENLPSGSTIENASPVNLKTLRNLSEEQYEMAYKIKEGKWTEAGFSTENLIKLEHLLTDDKTNYWRYVARIVPVEGPNKEGTHIIVKKTNELTPLDFLKIYKRGLQLAPHPASARVTPYGSHFSTPQRPQRPTTAIDSTASIPHSPFPPVPLPFPIPHPPFPPVPLPLSTNLPQSGKQPGIGRKRKTGRRQSNRKRTLKR